MEDGSTQVNSTKLQIEELKSSIIWGDIVRELNIWQETFRIEMSKIVDNAADSNPSTASVLMYLGDINGRIKAVEYIKSLPDTFLEILKIKSEDAKLKGE